MCLGWVDEVGGMPKGLTVRPKCFPQLRQGRVSAQWLGIALRVPVALRAATRVAKRPVADIPVMGI